MSDGDRGGLARPTAEAVAEALARVRAAGRRLAARPARDRLEAIAAVFDRLADPASALHRALADQLPAATGFTPATVREGLRLALGAWSGADLLALADRELGGAEALEAGRVRGFASTGLILAGALPMPTLLDVLAPLCLGSAVLAKPSVHDPLTAALLARDLAGGDPELGASVETLEFRGDDEACTGALLQADCVVVTGSDETVARVSARVQPPRRVVAHGHRFSVAAIGPDARPDAAERLARDVALWDQLGCLSPVAVFAVGACDPSEALAAALAAAEMRWPRGRVSLESLDAAARERDEAVMRGAFLHTDESAAFSVVRETDARLRPAPLHRFVRVHPVADASALLDALRPAGAHLACVALEGLPDAAALAEACTRLGASRICPPGVMQAPPLDWPRENRGVLAPLAQWEDGGPV